MAGNEPQSPKNVYEPIDEFSEWVTINEQSELDIANEYREGTSAQFVLGQRIYHNIHAGTYSAKPLNGIGGINGKQWRIVRDLAQEMLIKVSSANLSSFVNIDDLQAISDRAQANAKTLYGSEWEC